VLGLRLVGGTRRITGAWLFRPGCLCGELVRVESGGIAPMLGEMRVTGGAHMVCGRAQRTRRVCTAGGRGGQAEM
jgi:hypothetical protein